MSLNSQTTPSTTIPSVTGYPGIDSLIRSALIAAAAALTGVILTWLNKEGFNDPNLNLLISGVILTVLTTLAVAAWGWFKGAEIGKVVDNAHLVGVQAGVAAQQASAVPTGLGLLTNVAPADITHSDAKAIIAIFAPPKV